MTLRPHPRSRRPGIASLLVVTAALMGGPLSAPAVAQTAMPDVLVKAAFVFNFAKFTEWPSLPHGAGLVACVAGEDDLAAALVATIRGQQVSGRAIEVSRRPDTAGWAACHLLFVSGGLSREQLDGLAAIRARQILTIGDSRDFARSGGIIELYVEQGRIRFAINTEAADRTGLRISSQVLALAKVVRDNHAR